MHQYTPRAKAQLHIHLSGVGADVECAVKGSAYGVTPDTVVVDLQFGDTTLAIHAVREPYAVSHTSAQRLLAALEQATSMLREWCLMAIVEESS